jgi:thioredoxin reductase
MNSTLTVKCKINKQQKKGDVKKDDEEETNYPGWYSIKPIP